MTDTSPLHETATRIDRQLADLHDRRRKHEQHITDAADTIRRCAGQTRDRRGVWNDTLDNAIAATIERTWDQRTHATAGARLNEHRNHIAAIDTQTAALQQVWRDNGCWTRFFLVTNTNGHIHSTTACRTCVATTTFAWLPELSGLSEHDAVGAHGSILCTVCFPEAPVEWTNGESHTARTTREERETAAAKRAAAKLEKALMPDGSDLIVRARTDSKWEERLATLHAAKGFLTDHFEYEASGYGYDTAAVDRVAAAISTKTGDTITEVLDAARERARRRRR